MDLCKLLGEQKDGLKQAAEGLATRNPEKTKAGLTTALLGMATMAAGHPELAPLVPLAEAGILHAFVHPANRILERQIAEAKDEEEKRRVLGNIAQTMEVLLEDSLIRVARIQHGTKDEILRAMAGMEQELADFRDQLRRQLDASGVRVEISVTGHHNQVASGGGIAIGGSVASSVFVTGSGNSVKVR
jgi:hypothetical protein